MHHNYSPHRIIMENLHLRYVLSGSAELKYYSVYTVSHDVTQMPNINHNHKHLEFTRVCY